MINSFFGTVFLLCFVFQNKEKEQGLGSRVVKSKERLPKNFAKSQRERGNYPIPL